MIVWRNPNNRRGYTLLEVLLVIGIIMLLTAFLITGLSKLRTRTQRGQCKNLLEKVHNGLETYNLKFRAYPPATVAGLTGSNALYYWLATSFRQNPGAGDVLASIDAGPFVDFEQRDLRETGGKMEIIDPWNTPLAFQIIVEVDGMGFSFSRPKVYSWGPNKLDDNANGPADVPPGDDLTIGQ